jgi:beta-mannanase
VNEPDYQLSDVISGRYDTYIREFATKAKAWGHPFLLRFNWEMNGNWFPWAEGVNGNQPGQYVAAWRHVHDIFTAVGATNVSWVWCPNVEWNGTLANIASTYPGDEYVDWTGLDGYNWGTNPAHPGRWETFRQLYRSTYQYITETVAPSKPMLIGEIGSTEYGGSKATWIREMLSQIPTEYPKIRALLWFDKFDSGMDWPIETSSTAESAFAEGIHNPAYVGNEFSALTAGAIQPPS